MKGKLLITVSCICAVTAIAATGIGFVGGKAARNLILCTGVDVTVAECRDSAFITDRDVYGLIARDFGGCVNRPCDSINLIRLEKMLDKIPYIGNSEAYFTHNGILHINVSQNLPVIKLDINGKIHYLNGNGELFIADRDREGLMTVTGDIPADDAKWRKGVADLAAMLADGTAPGGRVCGITSDNRGELTLTLSGREESFSMGRPENLRDKLDRICIYEDRIASGRDADRQYKNVNLKYNGQIICK